MFVCFCDPCMQAIRGPSAQRQFSFGPTTGGLDQLRPDDPCFRLSAALRSLPSETRLEMLSDRGNKMKPSLPRTRRRPGVGPTSADVGPLPGHRRVVIGRLISRRQADWAGLKYRPRFGHLDCLNLSSPDPFGCMCTPWRLKSHIVPVRIPRILQTHSRAGTAIRYGSNRTDASLKNYTVISRYLYSPRLSKRDPRERIGISEVDDKCEIASRCRSGIE